MQIIREYIAIISTVDLLCVYFLSSVSFGNSRMKDCYQNGLEKQNNFSYDFIFNESLSKFSITNNFVVIVTVRPDETFYLCVIQHLKVNYNEDV